MNANFLGNIGRRKILERLAAGAALVTGAVLGSVPRAAQAAETSGINIALFAMFVSNLERSTRFYQALGFEGGEANPPPPSKGPDPVSSKLYQTEATLSRSQLHKNGINLELIHFEGKGAPPPRTVRELGLSHISLNVDDMDRVLALVKQSGGTVLEETRVKIGEPGKGRQIIFCADPDGNRLALLGPLKA